MLKEWATQVFSITGGGGSWPLRPRDPNRVTGRVTITQDITDYTHGLGLISQRVTDSSFFRWDGRATCRRIEDSARNTRATDVWDAYGLLRSGVTLTSAYGFVGEQGVRGEKGLNPATLVPQHMRARMYDPMATLYDSAPWLEATSSIEGFYRSHPKRPQPPPAVAKGTADYGVFVYILRGGDKTALIESLFYAITGTHAALVVNTPLGPLQISFAGNFDLRPFAAPGSGPKPYSPIRPLVTTDFLGTAYADILYIPTTREQNAKIIDYVLSACRMPKTGRRLTSLGELFRVTRAAKAGDIVMPAPGHIYKPLGDNCTSEIYNMLLYAGVIPRLSLFEPTPGLLEEALLDTSQTGLPLAVPVPQGGR